MAIDLQFADRVLGEAVKRGNNQDDIQKHLNTLDSAGQEQFVNEMAQAFGLGKQPVADGYSPSTGESLLLGASQALPVQDELSPVSGAIEKGIAKFLPESLGGISSQAYQDLYADKSISELGKETTAMLGEAKEEHPWAYGIGQGLGAAALAAPFGAAAGTIPAMIGQGAVTGALEAEGGLGERLKGAAIGGAVGGVAGPAVKGLGAMVMGTGRAIGGAAQGFGKASTAAARRALGFRAGLVKQAGGVERVNDLVRTLQDEGLFTKGLGLDKVAEQVDEHARNSISSIDRFYSGPLGGASGLTVSDLKTAIANRVRASLERAKELHPSKLSQLDQIDELITRIGQGKESLSLSELWQLTKDLGDKAWEKGVTNENLSVFQDAWKVLKDAAAKGIKQAPEGGEEAFRQLQKANKVYSAAKEVSKALDDKFNREAGNKGFGLMSAISAGVGGTIGGFPGAAAGAALQMTGEKFGAQAASVSARKLSEVAAMPTIDKLLRIAPKLGRAGKALTDAASRGPAAVSSTHFILQQTSPEYREAWAKQNEMGLE